jgi:hypothetical protein
LTDAMESVNRLHIMLNINVTSDIDAAMKSVGDFFRNQIPYATSVAINNTIFDVRRDVIEVTWPKSFKVRNQALPRRLFKVTEKATKANLRAMLSQDLDRSWVERQATGGVKTGASGGRVAIPTNPEPMRTSTGRIKAPLKPNRLAATKGVYVIQKGTKTLIMKRDKKNTKLLYSIVSSARISKRFSFNEDAVATTIRVFPGYWRLAMNASIASSRFRLL